MPSPTEGSLHLPSGVRVSTLHLHPAGARALLTLAHGAGAGMRHDFLEKLCAALAEGGVATLRFQFPYMERADAGGPGWPPDRDALLVETVRAAVARGRELSDGLPLLAGGKSLGGRMTSVAAAEGSLEGVVGLVLVGFPLHGRGKPSIRKGEHLSDVRLPTLFLQGTRDDLADLELLRAVLDGMRPPPTLHVVEGADHGFHVLKRSGRTDADVLVEVAERVARWVEGLGG